ncbi:hypothetical protein AB0K00_31280 [Dactylosporangium sp. NPDC049525]|uniref:hypothetical protein n=1 Tax=Dactylosporangium sp. NPDC049525 TaxID=3154730 RepID=UPI003436D655
MFTPEELLDETCVACPGQRLPLGAFDVAPRPSPAIPFSAVLGYRVAAATGVPTCVHAFRVGVPPGLYASGGVPLPTSSPVPAPSPVDLELPADGTLLEAWLLAVVRTTPADRLPVTLARAEQLALERFPPAEILAAMRRVLGGG